MNDPHALWGFGVFIVLLLAVLVAGGWWANRELERMRRELLPPPDPRVERAGNVLEFKRRVS